MQHLIVTTFLTLLFHVALIAQADWAVDINKENITIGTRVVPNSDLKEYKAEMVLKADKEAVLRLLTDFKAYIHIFDNYKSTTLIKQTSETEYLYYVEMNAPWPVSNRDLVIRFKIEENNAKGVRVKLEAVPSFMPEKKGIVRVPYLKGEWLIVPQSKNEVKLINQVHASAGGSVPAWLANQTMTQSPFISFKNIRAKIVQYQ